MEDLERWLAALGLEELAPVLRANDVDLELLPELTEVDLEKLGVSVGQRKKLLKAAASLSQPASAALRAAPTPSPSVSAERRQQLTVMFYDLVGSTALATRHDPEDVREAIGAFHRRVGEAVVRFGGFVARTLGDGALVYFGYPQAHEDDAERAVRAGLVAVEAIAGLMLPNGLAPQMRVGIATGLVVVGDIVGTSKTPEEDVTGETPNLAARLQAIAEPGGIVISARTRRLLGNLFECRDLGSVEMKGFDEPVQVWQVLRESGAESRFEALRTEALTPLVGREEEIELLLDCWQRAKHGAGQVVLISGEPGIGKSRLIAAELRERLQAEPPHTLLRYFCSPYHTDSALYPIVAQLERAAGFAREDTPETKLDKLEAVLAATSTSAEDVTLVAELLLIPATGRHPPLNLSPQRKKEKTLEVLLGQLAALARQRPLLMIFEDVHWIDPSSRELLELTVERVSCLPALLLITFRPEFQAPLWTGQAHVTTLTLHRLDQHEGMAMVERIARHKTLPGEIVDQIVAKTDGVPLFVEELTKMVLESGLLEDRGNCYALVGPLPPLAIPATLQDSLMARLDRLAPVKEVAQIGAAIGRAFSHDLLAAVVPLGERELQKALDQLADAGLIFRREAAQQASYTFKHTLVQDAAYQMLLRSTRQRLHARIASVLEERFPETAETEPEFLAHHCAQAGLIEKAVDYRLKAGLRSIQRFATAEAVAQLEKGLELLANLPTGPERDRQELSLQVASANVLAAARGHGAQETSETLGRARELCDRTGDRSRILPVLHMQSNLLFARADFDATCKLGEEMRRLGQEWGDTVAEMLGDHQLGVGLFALGQFVLARAHLEQMLSVYDPKQHHPLPFLYGQNPRVSGLSWLSHVLFPLGYPEQALKRSEEALADSRQLANVNVTAVALLYGCALHQLCRNRQAARERSEELISLCTDQGLSLWLAAGHCQHGWALAGGDEPEVGIAELTQGIAAYRAAGTNCFLPYLLALRAAAQRDTGQSAEPALDLLREAFSRASESGERWFEAELHRLRGECLLSVPAGDEAEAEASFLRALEVARRQSARMWELRAATSLARLWRDQGKCTKARDLLAPLYGWFTEGHDKSDLRDASMVLDELRQ